MSDSSLKLVHSRKEISWQQVNCETAKTCIDTHVVWWRPNLPTYSKDPDSDIAWIAED